MTPRQRGSRGLLTLTLVLAGLTLAGFTVWFVPRLAGSVSTGRWTTLGFWQEQDALLRAIVGKHPRSSTPPRFGARSRPPRGSGSSKSCFSSACSACGWSGCVEEDAH